MKNKNLLERLIFIFSVLIGLAAFLYIASPIMLPFAMAMIFAYLLGPLMRIFGRYDINKSLSSFFVVFSFFVLLVALLSFLLPILYQELHNFANNIPKYIQFLKDNVWPFVIKFGIIEQYSPVSLDYDKTSPSIINVIQKILQGAVTSSLGIINLLSFLFLTPILLFYFLRDWEIFTGKIIKYIPRKHLNTVQEQLNAIDLVLSGYLRGQTLVCCFLAFFYSLSLILIGLENAIFIGLTAGILSFIPYLGVLFAIVTSTILCLFQFGFDMQNLLLIFISFTIIQVIESNFITPKLIGEKIGLHPLWIIFSLLLGGSMLGFLGVLIALPVAAILGVLVKFAMNKYFDSTLYNPKL